MTSNNLELIIPDFISNVEISLSLTSENNHIDPINLSNITIHEEEKIILRDLFTCLIGGSGTYIKQEQDKKKISYKLNFNIRNSTRSFVENLLPLCENYVKTELFTEKHYEFHYGKVCHVLCNGLRVYLVSYLQKISELETLPRLTLSMLCISLRKEVEIFDVLVGLLDDVDKKVRGAPICSAIYRRLSSYRGSTHIRDVLHNLFIRTVEPVLDYIHKWIYNGVIDDLFMEFFIKEKDLGPDHIDIFYTYWENHFESVAQLVPSFIPSPIVNKIIDTGKVQYVLCKIGCKLDEPIAKLTIESIQYDNLILSIFEKASLRLVTEINTTHCYLECLKVIWDIFLFKRSDLFSMFMRVADHKMRQQPQMISDQDLEDLLSIVYKDRQMKYLSATLSQSQLSTSLHQVHSVPEKLTSRTRITKSKTCWELFSLNLKIAWPLNIILSKDIQMRYTIISRYILLWKRLLKQYGVLWQLEHYTLRTKTGKVLAESQTYKKLSAARFSIHSFITAIDNFISSTVIHPSFSKLMKKTGSAKSVEELMQIHEESQQILKKGTFCLDVDLFNRSTYIATNIWYYGKTMKEWFRASNNQETTEQQRMEFAKFSLNYYATFQSETSLFIRDLKVHSKNEGSSIYVDLALLLTGNKFFTRIENM